MIAARLLGRLDAVRKTGPDRWMARCPAHPDRIPSLSVRLGEDGRLLINCLASCEFADVVHAAGLEVSDLFPPRASVRYGRQPRLRVHPADALAYLIHAARILSMVAADIRRGEPISEQDWETFDQAVRRIRVIEHLFDG